MKRMMQQAHQMKRMMQLLLDKLKADDGLVWEGNAPQSLYVFGSLFSYISFVVRILGFDRIGKLLLDTKMHCT